MRLIKVPVVLGVLVAVSVHLKAAALERWENTSLRLPQQLSARGFGTSNAFPGLTFSLPVGLVSAPGDTNRLFIIEARGRIQVITNLSNPNKTLFLDLSSRVY